VVRTLPDGSSSSDMVWGEMIYPYVKNAQVFRCPSDFEPMIWRDGATYNYFWNYSNGQALNYRSLGAINYPAELIMSGDGSSYVADPFRVVGGANAAGRPQFWATPTGGDYITDGARAGHNGGGNFVFVDGHGKWLSFPEAISNNNYWNAAR
jgi:prepilin-type processing-associated H-X9-DG protein